MIQFVCDWCGRLKWTDEKWIVGIAAEAIGVTAARREVTVLSGWDSETAVLPLAVHFCSVQCKGDYMAQLFAPESPAEKVTRGAAEIVVERKDPEVQRVVTKMKKRSLRKRRRAA